MRKVILTALVLLAVPALIAQADEGEKMAPKAPLVHSVIFYLKKDTSAEKRDAMIADCHTMLGKIPTVRGVWAGEPAPKAKGDIAVNDYQVGLLILFENDAGLKTYIDHPEHLKFVDAHKALFEKVLVYDFADKAAAK